MKAYIQTEPYSAKLPVFLMGRWVSKSFNDLETAYTTNLGAQILFQTNHVHELQLKFKRTIPQNAVNQLISVDIDQRKKLIELDSEIVTIKLPNDSLHNIRITFAGNTDADQVWTEQGGLAITDINCDEGDITAIKPNGPTMLFIGDSITAGCWVRSKTPSCGYGADINYAARTAKHFDAIDYRVAYSAAGVSRYGAGGVPVAGRFLNYVDIDTPAPETNSDLVIINLGTNDRKLDAQTFIFFFRQFLTEVQNKFPDSSIVVMIPFNQAFSRTITNLIQNEFKNMYLIPTSHWHIKTTDGTHPNKQGSIHAAHNLISAIKKMNLI